MASWAGASKIVNYLLENEIKINNCDLTFETANFFNVDIATRIIEFVNPKIISSNKAIIAIIRLESAEFF